jgi:phosphotransferase system HPr-like phosphotransfer protein
MRPEINYRKNKSENYEAYCTIEKTNGKTVEVYEEGVSMQTAAEKLRNLMKRHFFTDETSYKVVKK